MRNLQSNIGIQYTAIGDTERRGEVVGYHNSPSPAFLLKATTDDVNGLSESDKLNINRSGLFAKAKFAIGFEVEKTSLRRGAVMEYALFKGFERDSSCGYEAVTHVLPLVGRSMWRTKVFNMFAEAKSIIDEQYSPSDYSCGGHMTFSVDGMDGHQLMDAVRPFSGIIYALFRKRLNNSFCNGNIEMSSSFGYSKYTICKINENCLEFRVPSRITSVKCMMDRYKLMYTMLDFAINQPNARLSKFHRAIRPIILSMYEGNVEKADAILGLAVHFTQFLKTGKIDKYTCGWFEAWTSSRYGSFGSLRRKYKRTFRPIGCPQSSINDFKERYDILL